MKKINPIWVDNETKRFIKSKAAEEGLTMNKYLKKLVDNNKVKGSKNYGGIF